MSLFAFSPVLLWFLAGLVFFALELLLPGLVVFFFGIGAWCAALAVYCLPMALSGQLLVFLATSLLALALLRSTLKKVFLGRKTDVDAMDGDVSGAAVGVVIEAIAPPAAGKVKYGGSFWLATADQPVSVGTVVRILKKENLIVNVKPVATEGEA
jgi:membrane protein implicated in regulation of membrane protease activity